VKILPGLSLILQVIPLFAQKPTFLFLRGDTKEVVPLLLIKEVIHEKCLVNRKVVQVKLTNYEKIILSDEYL